MNLEKALTIPRMGCTIPNMGIKRKTRKASDHPLGEPAFPGLADALFSRVQQRVLGILFGNPSRSFYATEIIRLARSGSGAVQRELARLQASGLLTATQVGNQKHYQANPESPLFEELRRLSLKTFALADVLRSALEPVATKIRAAFAWRHLPRLPRQRPHDRAIPLKPGYQAGAAAISPRHHQPARREPAADPRIEALAAIGRRFHGIRAAHRLL